MLDCALPEQAGRFPEWKTAGIRVESRLLANGADVQTPERFVRNISLNPLGSGAHHLATSMVVESPAHMLSLVA